MEEYRKIQNYENQYEVSNFGEVRSIDRYVKCRGEKYRLIKGCVLKQRLNVGGYSEVGLDKGCKKKMIRVHTLVADAFPEICGNRFDGCHIDHIDGNKLNNNATNLRFCTEKENHNNPITLKRNGKAHSKKVVLCDLQGNEIICFNSIQDAVIFTNGDMKTAWKCMNGIQNKHKGYKWKYYVGENI